jgi:hypothetical protein
MKRHLFLLIAFLVSAGMLATQSLSAQKRVIKVQGHPHELLTEKHGDKEDAGTRIVRATGDVANIVLDSITCWAGNPDPSLPIDSAVLLVKWTDGKMSGLEGDSTLAWGYRWNSASIYVDPDTGEADTFPTHKYTIDMIRAVANVDCHFAALLQNTGGGNFVVGGFGYNLYYRGRLPMTFNQAGAAADALIKFHYTGSPNCAPPYVQEIIPFDAPQQVNLALKKYEGDDSITGTGIIRHPFDADYGYPAYDFDYWMATSEIYYYEWQSGWYRNGYWAFHTKNQLNGDFTDSLVGIAQREIHNHYVDGFVFEDDPSVYPPPYNMTGDFTTHEGCNCGCNAPAKKTNVTNKQK